MERKLKILVLSSLYPPHYIGGYELGCGDVVDGLRERGHDVRVLTSTYGVAQPCFEGHIYRWLSVHLKPLPQSSVPNQWSLFKKELANRQALRRMLALFQPDLVYVWSIHSASLSLINLVQNKGIPVTYFVSDHWMTRPAVLDSWRLIPQHPLRWAVRFGLGLWLDGATGSRPTPPFSTKQVPNDSHFLATITRAVLPINHAFVIHWGITTQTFNQPRIATGNGRRLLYVGQVLPHKGVHTIIQALALLVQQGYTDLHLTIAGGALFPEYRATIEQQIEATGVEMMVQWTGHLPRAALPAIYAEHDVLLFPSVWDEPFSITLLEAMAAGLAVIATRTGGTPEIIDDGETGLLFTKEDAIGCARAIQRLIDDPSERERLATQGQQRVTTAFQLTAMVEQIEQALIQTISV